MKQMPIPLLLSIFVVSAFIAEAGAATTLPYDYDAVGNMIRGEGKYYEYNDANQLVKVRNNDAAGAVIAEYFYDYNGQRIKKVENGVTTYYIGKHYEKQFAGNSQSSTDYYFANGERVAKKESTGKLTYFHPDHLGGTNATTDAAGNLVERTKYYPFGEMREGGSEKYSYTGKEKDKQTDWYYYEARYYNPQLKHFTQADTVTPNVYYPQELNRYAYVKNNPMKYVDPTGHFSWPAFFRKLLGIKTAEVPTSIANNTIEPTVQDTKTTNTSSDPVFKKDLRGSFDIRYCTGYAADKFSKGKGIPWRGNAGDWLKNAPKDFERGNIPKEGALMVKKPSDSNGFGHVAYVEKINDDGTFLISDQNNGSWIDPKNGITTAFGGPPETDVLNVNDVQNNPNIGFIYYRDYEFEK